MRVVLKCPVKGCSASLRREGPRWTCPSQHSFDQRRSGALNLLQPQDRRSRTPGDSRETALARRRLSTEGLNDSLYKALADHIARRPGRKNMSLLDVGCGEGAFLRFLGQVEDAELHGVDISSPSIDLAAKATPDTLFVAANADRSLPYAERSFDVLTSIDARTNAGELARVLRPGGLLLVAVPAPDDLIELRERVQGRKVEKSRAGRVQADLSGRFRLVDSDTVRDLKHLEPPVLRDLLAATYRGFRQSERAAIDALSAMNVTLSHDILAFEACS